MYKVYVTDHDYADLSVERSVPEPIGARVIGLLDRTGERLAETARDAEAVTQQYAKNPAATIAALDHCKVIARYGIGLDILDVEAAHAAGIVVTNVPDYCIEEVADHSITMALTLLRSIPSYVDATRRGTWHWSSWSTPIRRLRGSKFGLIGFGRIAQNMAHKLHSFCFELLAYDPYVSASLMASHGVKKVELNDSLASSDLVDVMCPYTPQTHHLIDEAATALMKPGTPHVTYVSENALYEARRVAAETVRTVLLGQTPPNVIPSRH